MFAGARALRHYLHKTSISLQTQPSYTTHPPLFPPLALSHHPASNAELSSDRVYKSDKQQFTEKLHTDQPIGDESGQVIFSCQIISTLTFHNGTGCRKKRVHYLLIGNYKIQKNIKWKFSLLLCVCKNNLTDF